jgi:sterol desaturase/sphingolipid hydroxylase (fatty acid hydroxylase superfamily)
VLTSTTYHSLHHSRYVGNFGLGTRLLDRIFNTEWDDYEPVYDRISHERRPLAKLRERAVPPAGGGG